MSGHRHFMPDGQATGFIAKPAAGSALVVGQIESVVGSCSLTRPGGDPFQIKPGDPICRGDFIETTAGGKVGIRFIDGTAFNLSDSARFVVTEFGCDGAEPSALFDISRGTFAFIAGEMAKSGGLRVQTPFANIRGRAQSGGIGMLSLASLFFAALENAQAATTLTTTLHGTEDGILNIRDSYDIINAPFGIIELTVGSQTIFIDNPFFEWIVRGTSVSQLPLSPAQLLQHQVESNNVSNIASLGQGPTVGGPSGSSSPPPPEPPPFVQPINNVVPQGPTGGPNGGPGGPGGPGLPAAQDIPPPPPPPPPPPLPPPGPNEINELADTTGSSTHDTTSGTLPSTIVSINSPTFTWTGGPITDVQKTLLADIVWSGGPLSDAQRATAAAATTLPPPGSTAFDFKIVDGAVDFVAFGENLKFTYQVTFSDGSTQPVVVTVFGTNDLPVITSDAQSGLVAEIADNAAGENVTVHHQSDTITFTDVDLTNIETSAVSSRQVTSATLANGFTLTAAQQNALLSAFSVDPATHSSVNGTGTVVWHYDISDGALDFLGENDQLTLTFTVRVSDGFGGIATQDVVITVNGTEDAPVITSEAQSGSVAEIADNAAGEHVTVHHQSDTITFTDVDLSDIETGSVTGRQVTSATLANGYTLTAAQQNALLNAFTIEAATHLQANGIGTVVWHYDISDGALDFLGENDQLTLTFTVQVDDGHGGTTSQNVVITVNGTEDAPVITSEAQSGSVKEVSDGAPGENITVHHQSDTITFTDVDLSDIETSAVTSRQVTSTTLANGFTLTAAQQNALLSAFSVEAATHSQANGTGTVVWHYDISDSALDFLGDDDQVTLTFTVQVSDGHGGSATQNVVLTVNGGVSGTEDAPVITSDPQSGLVTEIADNAAGENVTVHHQSDTITFTDVDLSDAETSSVTSRQVTSATLANGYTLTAAQQNALLNAFSVEAATHSQANGTGTVDWHYDISDGALDFLGDDDQLILTFTVQVNDGHGGTASQDVVITVNGTEDIPVISSGPQSGAVTEISDNAVGENVTIHHQTGTVTFTDVDLSDVEAGSVTARQVTTATLANGYALTAAQQNALLNAFTIDTATHSQANGTGTVGWHYDISDGALDFLGDDDQLTLTFTVQVNDGQGGIATQNVVITVNGTEDIPVVTSGAQSGSVSEIADNAVGENVTVHHQTGTVTFTDVDLSDVEAGSVTARQVTTATLANGYALTAAQQNALLNAFTIDTATHSSVNGTGTVGWHYDISDGTLDFLGDDDQLILTFTVQVNDGHGGLASQNVTITVNGTEDKPVITSGAQSGSVSEIADNAPGENVTAHHQTGNVNFTDVDLSDVETGSVTARQVTTATLANGYTLTAAQQNALLNAFTIDAATHSQANGTGTVVWHYDISDSALDFLGDDDQVTLTFTVQVSDGHGGLASQNVVITVNGTEDVPLVTTTNNSFAELAGTNNPNTDSVSGTISFNDVDLSDRPTVATAFNGYTYTAADGVTALSLTASQQTAILKALALGPTPPNTSSGSVTWTYSVADNALDFLAQNETVILTYNATVNDLQGGIVIRPVTVTIHGTNDAPVIKYTGAYALDQFNTQDYGAWVELGNNSNGAVNGSPLNGEFQIAHDSRPSANADAFQIQLTDLDAESDVADTLTRTFNLDGAGNTAKLEFDYRREIPNAQSDDDFNVLISINGGPFTQLVNIGVTTNANSVVDNSYLHFIHDISLPAGQTIQSVAIRFSVGDEVDNGDIVYVDNVKLSYATPATPTQTINYTENSAVGVFTQVTDVDHNAVITSATITIGGHLANDLLSVSGALPGSIHASSYDAVNGVLTLSGNASLADYQDALSHILFSNTGNSPGNTDRTLTITVNDGMADSTIATTTIHVIPVNDGPPAVSNLNVTDTSIAFNITDPDDSSFTLSAPFGAAFGNPTLGGAASLLPAEKVSAVSGTLQVSDGAGGTANVVGLYLGTSGGNTATAPLASSPNAIYGFGGSDKLIGGTAADFLFGGAGSDTLVGAGGNDTLVGGADSDQFRLATNVGTDTIADFVQGADKIGFLDTGSNGSGSVNFANTTGSLTGAALNASDFASRTSITNIQGGDDETAIVITSAQTTAQITGNLGSSNSNNNYVIVFNSTTGHGEIWFDSNWGNTDNRIQVATLNNVTTLAGVTAIAASDIVVHSSAADPIILDLGTPGISFSPLASGVTFDINGDGAPDQVAWNTSNDGILAYDLNGSGTIENGTELFTPDFGGGNFSSGLAALNSLDSNNNGVIDSADTAFGNLRVWQDSNHNGIADAGELSTLADKGIASIRLDATPTDATVDGQQLQAQGSFTYADGTSGAYIEVALDTAFGTAPASPAEATGTPESHENNPAPDSTQTSTAGNDTIIAASGNTLTGNSGNDTFVFKAVADSLPGEGNFNTITDFTHNSDHIDITAIAGANVVQGSVSQPGAVDAHSVSWFADTAQNHTIVYVNTTGTAGHVDMEIHLTGSNINLSGSDILHHT